MIQRIARAGVWCVVFFVSLRASFGLEDVTARVRVERTPLGGGGFVRGDANADGKIDISDPVYTLGYLFLGSAPPGCLEALNADDSEKLDITDAIYVLGFLFLGGPPPRAPFPGCGEDPTPGFGCASYPPCGGGGGDWSVRIQNISGAEILAPLIATVDSVSDPSVTVENEDGAYGGKPYFDYSALLSGGSLASGEQTAERTWAFRNPSGLPFGFGVKVYASAPGGGGWIGGADPLGEGPRAPERKAGRIDPDVVEYSIRVPGFAFRPRIEKPGLFQALSTEVGNRLGDVGRPGVPTFAQLLAVPRGGQVMVEVKEGEGVRYGGFRPYPTQHSPDDNRDAEPPPFVFDEKFYARNVLYPESLVQVREFEFRGTRIAVVELALARANPGKGELIVYPEIGVRVGFGGQGFRREDYIDPADRTLETEPVHGISLLNVSVVRGDVLRIVRDRVTLRYYDLLIIAPRAFEAAAEDLAAWKRSLGISTLVAYTDAIGGTAADIEAYVRARYSRNRISYLLLFGDAEHIPPQYRTRHPTGQSPRRMGTDLYYATMGPAGDIVPDIAYGRIPASTAAEAAMIVAKIRGYEGSPPFSADFYRRATLAAYFEDGDRNDTEDRLFTRAQEDVAQFLAGTGKVPVRVFFTRAGDPRWWQDGTAIPFWLRQPGFPWDGDAADISGSIAIGSFLVTHRDHAWWGGWSDPAYGLGDIADLTNGALLPVVFSINCQSGWFDRETDEEGGATSGESFAESFLTRSGGGAVGVIAATRDSPSEPNDRLYRAMIDCIWPDFIPGYPGLADAEAAALAGSRALGWVLNYAKLRVLAEYPTQLDWGANLDGIRVHQREFELYHCLGDPTLQVRLVRPFPMRMAIEALDPYLFEYWWTCPPEYDGARIAVVRGAGCERTLGSGIVSGGKAHLFFPPEEPLRSDQDLYLVASKEGHTPFMAKLELPAACILECLEVPVGAAGPTGLGEFGVAADGKLVSLGAMPLSGTGDQACCASGFVGTSKYLFAGHNASGGIEMLEFVPGSLPAPVGGSPFPTKGGQPSYFAVNEAENLLFATTAGTLVESFAISAGGLAPLRGSPTAVKGAARALAAWTPGKQTYLYVGSMVPPKGIHGFRVLADGLELLGTFDLEKLGANRPGVDLEVARARGFLYVRDLDAGVFAFTVDPATGALTLVKGSPFDAGDFGSAIALTRKETYLYAAAGTLKPQISCFRIESSGALTPIGGAASPPVILSLVCDPSDGFLFGASRDGDGIARWKILADGRLDYLGLTPDGMAGVSPAALWAR